MIVWNGSSSSSVRVIHCKIPRRNWKQTNDSLWRQSILRLHPFPPLTFPSLGQTSETRVRALHTDTSFSVLYQVHRPSSVCNSIESPLALVQNILKSYLKKNQNKTWSKNDSLVLWRIESCYCKEHLYITGVPYNNHFQTANETLAWLSFLLFNTFLCCVCARARQYVLATHHTRRLKGQCYVGNKSKLTLFWKFKRCVGNWCNYTVSPIPRLGPAAFLQPNSKGTGSICFQRMKSLEPEA